MFLIIYIVLFCFLLRLILALRLGILALIALCAQAKPLEALAPLRARESIKKRINDLATRHDYDDL